MSKSLGLNLKSFFDQYLRDMRIPTFEYMVKGKSLIYHWTNCIATFNMPVKVMIDGKEVWLEPSGALKGIKLDEAPAVIEVDPNFYVYTSNTTVKSSISPNK
jgi:hypothetical protein